MPTHGAAPEHLPTAPAFEERQKYVAGALETRFGRVTWTPPGGRESDAVPRQELDTGALLRTYPQARASVRFRDGTFLRVNELTRLEIVSPAATSATSPQRGRFRVQQGEVLVTTSGVRPAGTVLVPHAEGTPRGTEFLVRVDPVDGSAEFLLFDGEMTLTSATSTNTIPAGHAGTVRPDGSVRIRPLLEVPNVLQWWIDYPFVLDVADLELSPAESASLASSMQAYRRGDLLQAVREYPGYPEFETPTRDGPRLYLAALQLSTGAISPARQLLMDLTDPQDSAARALRTVLHAFESSVLSRASLPGDNQDTQTPARTASEELALSYAEQAQHHLDAALESARAASQRAPTFGPAWARVAELEFAHGRSKAAHVAIQRALAESPALASAHAAQGFFLAAEGRFREAKAAFDQALALDPELALARLGRGLVQKHATVQWLSFPNAAGDLELERAAILEPRRAAFRAYLAKALLDRGEVARGLRDLAYAAKLDPGDPTPGFYSALGLQRDNRVNEAIDHLQHAQDLGEHRGLFRSPLLLDEDRAVRGANLARMYQDAGLDRLALAESTRAVEAEYTLGASHLFLANTYQLRRDPHQVSLRYETPWLTEYLLASLLSPIGAGVLSPQVSSGEYGAFFDRNRVGVVSQTDYESRGDWRQSGTAYGALDNFEYALDASYRSDRGQHPNGDFEQSTFTGSFKYQLSPADRLLLQVTEYQAEFGDTLVREDPADVHLRYRGTEVQEPLALLALDHVWQPGSHTLFLVGRLQDRVEFEDPDFGVRLAHLDGTGNVDALDPDPGGPGRRAGVRSATELAGFTTELQQIWETDRHRLLGGVRVQSLGVDSSTQRGAATVDTLFGLRRLKVPAEDASPEESFRRVSLYVYDTFAVVSRLQLTLGASYDIQRRPGNPFTAPALSGGTDEAQFSPKAGVLWNPWTDFHVRAAFASSLNGTSFDQSFRLEPAQVMGFTQAFRSGVPESVAGSLAGESVRTMALGFEQFWRSRRTFLTVDFEELGSEADRRTRWTTVSEDQGSIRLGDLAVTEQLRFRERSARVGLHQLVGDALALSAGYRVTDAELQGDAPAPWLPTDVGSTLQEVRFRMLVNHASGFVGSAAASWRHQENRGYQPELPGDAFWQIDLHAGWRFYQRRVEVLVGLLNLTDQDYRLNPLVLEPELPRGRTFTLSLRAAF